MEGPLRENLIVGAGNPLLDISAVVDKEFLAKYGMKENDAILADKKHKNLCSELIEKYKAEYIAGGSVQNAFRVAQWLLGKPNVTTLFGCVGIDEYSKILEERAISDGVNVRYQYTKDQPTGTCAVLITGHHRSLCANLAAANCFTVDHVHKPENRKLMEDASFYYTSGFFLGVSVPTIMEFAKYALEHNRPFIMNLSSAFICEFLKKEWIQVFPYVDVIFGNETEAEYFSDAQSLNTKDLKEIALKICELPKKNQSRKRVCVLTNGHNPVILAYEGTIKEFPVSLLPQEDIIDTNGAGDAFSGGFISQYIQGKSLDVCVRCGIWCATEIIKRPGCTFDGEPNFKP